MRGAALGPVLLLLACYRPDYSSKPCEDYAGCPDGYTCAAGFCQEVPGGGSGTPEDPGPVPPVPEARLRGGSYSMGSVAMDAVNEYSRPPLVATVQPFYLDQREVTVRLFRRCVEAGACTAPAPGQRCNYEQAEREDHPINCVGFAQAQEFCGWFGRRLPTEEEWEFAARDGGLAQDYPWGAFAPMASMDPALLCWRRDSTCAVASFAGTGAGFHDLAGNVWEWTGSRFCFYPDKGACLDPMSYAVRGGGFEDRQAVLFRTWTRLPNQPGDVHYNRGFRCARTP